MTHMFDLDLASHKKRSDANKNIKYALGQNCDDRTFGTHIPICSREAHTAE